MSSPYGADDSGAQPHGLPQNVPPPGQQPGYPYPTGYPGYAPGQPQAPWGGGPPPVPAEPSDVTISFWLWIVDVVIGLVGSIIAFARLSTIIDQILAASSGSTPNPGIVVAVVKGSIIVGAVVGIVVVLLHVLFAIFMRRGRNWARIVLTVLGGLGVLSTLVGLVSRASVTINGQEIVTRPGASTALSVIQALVIIAAIVMFFRPAANAYFAAPRR